jgi:hypothetical protein
MRALWSLTPTTLVGVPCLVVLLANHRGLGSKRVSGFERRLLVCRLSGLSPYGGGDRAGKRSLESPFARHRSRLHPRPAERGPEKRRRSGAERRDLMPGMGQPRTQSVACLSKWRVPPFNGQMLPIVECTVRIAWMHSQSYSSTDRLTYFFDPRPVLTLGSLARTTVALWEFRQFRFFRPRRLRASKLRLRDWASIICAVAGIRRDVPCGSPSQNLCDSYGHGDRRRRWRRGGLHQPASGR